MNIFTYLLWSDLCMWKCAWICVFFFLQCFAWPLFFRPDLQATRLSLAPASSKPGSQRYASPVSCRAASRHHSGDSGENGFDGRLVHGKIPPHVRYIISVQICWFPRICPIKFNWRLKNSRTKFTRVFLLASWYSVVSFPQFGGHFGTPPFRASSVGQPKFTSMASTWGSKCFAAWNCRASTGQWIWTAESLGLTALKQGKGMQGAQSPCL